MLSSALIAAARQVKTAGMDDAAKLTLREDIEAALDWWREAGVDGDIREAAQCWMAVETAEKLPEAETPGAAPRPAAAAAPPSIIDRSSWPQEFDGFAPWWLAESWLDEGRTSSRVPPRGVQGAELMILVAEPEREDGNTLLTGPQGRLLGAMLAAFGITEEAAYVASILPRHTPHADWDAVAARGLGQLACHHIALAAPQRLIVFGSTILSLLGHDPANNSGGVAEFAHGDCKVPMLAARDLAVLHERPRWKAALWQSWLDWTETK